MSDISFGNSQPPPLREAWARIQEICQEPREPPLTLAEVAMIVAACKGGGVVILRCWFESSP